ncbi:MAG: hypothetical protein Q9176_003762 [Flavoplaca citrina]
MKRTEKALYAASYQAMLKRPLIMGPMRKLKRSDRYGAGNGKTATAKQTLQQLERLQLDDPEIIRLRHLPLIGIVELDSELRGPIELPRCDMTAPSPGPDSCVYELYAVDSLHDLQEEHLTTPDITQSRGSETEPPCSGLEPVGEPKCGDHLIGLNSTTQKMYRLETGVTSLTMTRLPSRSTTATSWDMTAQPVSDTTSLDEITQSTGRSTYRRAPTSSEDVNVCIELLTQGGGISIRGEDTCGAVCFMVLNQNELNVSQFGGRDTLGFSPSSALSTTTPVKSAEHTSPSPPKVTPADSSESQAEERNKTDAKETRGRLTTSDKVAIAVSIPATLATMVGAYFTYVAYRAREKRKKKPIVSASSSRPARPRRP